MAPKIAIVYYTLYGHLAQLAEAEAEGIKQAGGTCDIFQIAETFSDDVLEKMHAKGLKSDLHPVLESPAVLEKYDAFLFGIPTRFGSFPAQWKVFWDRTGKQWVSGSYTAKYAGLFVSTGTSGGGQETTAINALSTLTHHGLIYVPLGYKPAFPELTNLDEPHGGSPWGAGTFAGGDNKRPPSALELKIARIQGESFYNIVSKVAF